MKSLLRLKIPVIDDGLLKYTIMGIFRIYLLVCTKLPKMYISVII